MKRVNSACICETLHFTLKRNVPPASAVLLVKQDIEKYKKLESECTPYKIIEESTQADGSVIVKIVRQYRHHPTGLYLNTLG